MAQDLPLRNKLCLLSLDGGGVRGLSSLTILRAIMEQVNQGRSAAARLKPCQIMDIIGGTSTGGLIAIMLGRLAMDVDDCIEKYTSMFADIFGDRSRRVPVGWSGDIKSMFKSDALRSAITRVVTDCGLPADAKFNDGQHRDCHTFVCATSVESSHVTRLRDYDLPGKPKDKLEMTIVDAALATSAASTFFDRVQIGDRFFRDGATGSNNPIEDVWIEAENLWNSDDDALINDMLGCLLSIGTGNPGIHPLLEKSWSFLSETLVQIATDTEQKAGNFEHTHRTLLKISDKRYYRFNVEQGLQDVGLEEYKLKGKIETATEEYLAKRTQENEIRACAQILKAKESGDLPLPSRPRPMVLTSDESICLKMPPSPLDHNRYTIWWICALPKELTAAVTMLDEKHNGLDQPASDHNNYTLGRIGIFNIVIACLPSGEIGTNAAASVATRMLATFPSLKTGLMVGIGGGAPSRDHDIRLGDVVVSMPAGQHRGVVQYDLGKSLKDGHWSRLGFLNSPSAVLKTTISKLISIHQVQGHKIQKYLSEMERNHPSLSKDFIRHSTLIDILYEPEPSDDKGFNDWVELLREPRSPDKLVKVHYGLIASGNQVVESGRRRDQLSEELGGVLCFEMEAAGLMNVFPFVVIRGICDYADAHKNNQWQEYAAAVAAAYAKELINTLPTSTATPISAASTAPSVKIAMSNPHLLLPLSRNKRFVGREYELKKLENELFSEDACQRVAIVGLGGVGKTQIVLELAYRKREDTPDLSIFWVPATQPAAFEQAYERICECLQLPKITKDIADVKHIVKESLSKDSIGPWLLIVDNADDNKMLYEKDAEESSTLALIDYLPFSRKGSIVFTTRNRKVAVKLAGNNVIQVGFMTPHDAKEVLRGSLLDKELLSDTEAVSKLLNLLGHLPLAIVQASAYMNENDTSIADYTDLYNGSEKEIIEILSKGFEDQGRYRDSQNSIAKTWLISFNQIQQQTPLAIEYLSFMACLLNQDIPQSILPQASSKKDFMEAVGALTAYSLLIRREDRKIFDIHGLVHLATRNWLRNVGLMTTWASKAVDWLAEIIPAGGHQERDIWTAYLPHAHQLLKSQDLESREEKFIKLSDHTGRCFYSNGRYLEAERVHRQTLDLRSKALGGEHPDTLMSSACFAEALSHQGKYAEAEKQHRETLDIRKKVLGVEHPDVMDSMQYLAQSLFGAGAYSEAEQIHRATRDLRAKVLHPEHRSTLTSTSYLAEVLNQQGNYEEAEQMHQQTLDTRIRLFGVRFPATLASMSCLGVTQRNLRKYGAAESTQREVLRLRIMVLGDRHPHTLITKRWLADALQNQAKYEEAVLILQEVLDMQAQLLGEKHPDTMHTLSNFAETRYSQGQITQAKGLYEEVYNLRKEALGRTHPDTLESMSNLATFAFRQGDIPKAKDMTERVLEMRIKRLGHDHPRTLVSIALMESLRSAKTQM